MPGCRSKGLREPGRRQERLREGAKQSQLPTMTSSIHPFSGLPEKRPRHISGVEQRQEATSTGGSSSGRPLTEFSRKLQHTMGSLSANSR